MKKLLLSLLLIPFMGFSQNLYNYGFEGTTADMITAGWQVTNQSSPVYTGAPTWSIPAAAPTTTFDSGAQAGTPTSFTLINYTSTGTSSTAGSGTISNWLISPEVSLKNGDVVSFYTRGATYAAVPTPANTFPDRLELRISTNGSFTTLPSAGSEDVGDFTTLAAEVNPDLELTGYPATWTQFSYTVTGLPDLTACKVAFRYYVTDGGPSGANSNIIAIDSFNVDRPLATDSFFAQNFSAFPNPATNVLNIANKSNSAINSIQITDMNGRTVKQVKGMVEQINISELNAGVYFLKVTSNQGTGTTKIIKK